MIRVILRDGTHSDFPDGKSAQWSYKNDETNTKRVTEVGAALEVRSEDSVYSGKVIGSFKVEEVIGYTTLPDEAKTTEEESE